MSIQEERKELAFNKLGNKCNKCGSVDYLEIDHMDPNSKHPDLFKKLSNYGGGSIWSLKEEDFYEEVKKCQLLCHNCHMDKTLISQGLERTGDKHNFSRYRNYGCRCDICKQAMRDHAKEYRDRKTSLSNNA